MATSWLKDRASILKATGDDLQKAVVKATARAGEVAPKEKHVRRLIVVTYDSPQDCVFAMRHMLERLTSKDWVVVLKTLTVFHRLFREGDEIAIQKVVPHPEVFGALQTFNDTSDTRAVSQSVFVRDYAHYLVEKLAVYSSLQYEFEKPPLPGAVDTPTTVIKAMSPKRLLKVVPKLQRQLNMLFAVDPNPAILDNGATVSAFTLVIKDAFKLFHVINDAILIIIDAFFDMKQSDALKSITIYQEYVQESDLIRDLMRKANSIPGLHLDLPSLKPASTGLLSALEEYVNAGNFDHTEADDVRDVSELLGDTSALPDNLVDTPGSAPAAAPAPAPAPAPLISFGNDPANAHLDPFGTPTGSPAASTARVDVFGSTPFEDVLAQSHSSIGPIDDAAPATNSNAGGAGGLLLFGSEPLSPESVSYDQKKAAVLATSTTTATPAVPAGIFGGPAPLWAGTPAAAPTAAPAAAGGPPPSLAAPLVPISSTAQPKTGAGAGAASNNNPFDFGDLTSFAGQ